MKKLACLAALVCVLAAVLFAQTSTGYLIPLWTGKGYVYPVLGPTLSVVNNQLNALIPTMPAVKTRSYDKTLTFDSTKGGWPLPAGVSDVVVHVNGLRYHAGGDYTITNNVVIPSCVSGANCQWDPTFLVTADYSQ